MRHFESKPLQRRRVFLGLIGWVAALMTDTNKREEEPDPCQTSSAPETCLVLLGLRVALVDIDGLSDGGGDGKGNTRTNLERSVDHSATQTLDVHWDTG